MIKEMIKQFECMKNEGKELRILTKYCKCLVIKTKDLVNWEENKMVWTENKKEKSIDYDKILTYKLV